MNEKNTQDEPGGEMELDRAISGLNSMKIEAEISSSLDGSIVVFKGRAKDTLTYVSVKRITKTPKTLDHVVHEVRILRKLQAHSRIVRFLDCYQTNKHTWVISEFISGNCLRDILVHTSFSFVSFRSLAKDMAQALLFLHQTSQLIHGDVRPENIVFSESGIAKLTGFGYAQWISQPSTVIPHHCLFNAEYHAPEVLTGLIDTPHQHFFLTAFSDVWTLGISLYESLHGVTPFTGTSLMHVLERVREDRPVYLGCDSRASGFLKLILNKDATQRLVEEDLLSAVEQHLFS